MLLTLIALVIVAILIYLLRLPPAYQVTRSIVIDKPIAQVFDYVRDFSYWAQWSPWSLHDPHQKNTLDNPNSVGGSYTWDSTMIGAGSMQHRQIIPNERLDILLTFIRPFKSKADIRFTFATIDGATQVTWTMDAKLPFVMRPLCAFMAKMIGHDFALGLALLRGVLDPNSEHPQIVFDGIVERTPQLYLTESFVGSFANMREAMHRAYPKFGQTLAQDPGRATSLPMIAAYHKVKAMKEWTVMDMGVPVTHAVSGETAQTLGGGKYFQMTFRGNYELIGSGWNTLYGQVKMKKLKIDKRRPALEVYHTNPMQAAHSNDWVTLLCVPIR